MKNLFLIVVLFFTVLSANAQLAGTKWKGKVNIPDPTDVIFNFKTDVVDATTATGAPVESCSYIIKADTITLKKTKGGSPCPVNSIFTLRYAVKDDKLILTLLADDCEGRKGTFTGEPFVKIKD